MTRSIFKRVEAAENRMIKACTVSLKDDTNHIPEPKYMAQDSQQRKMGGLVDATYNVRRTYHF